MRNSHMQEFFAFLSYFIFLLSAGAVGLILLSAWNGRVCRGCYYRDAPPPRLHAFADSSFFTLSLVLMCPP